MDPPRIHPDTLGSVVLKTASHVWDYDAGGVDPIRGPLREWVRDAKVTLRANPCRFGGKVQGAGVIYELARPRSVTNEQYFHNFWESGWHGDTPNVQITPRG